jgi:hypothetical protein
MKNKLITTPDAAQQLGISVAQFRRIIEKRDMQPAGTYTNPHYRSGPRGLLWSPKQIGNLKRTSLVKEARTSGRSAAAKKGAETKREQLLSEITNLNIVIPEFTSIDKIIRLAIDAYNDFHDPIAYARGNDEHQRASIDSDPSFLQRISINFIRHQCTGYDHILQSIKGRTGIADAHDLLQDAINDAITEKYPELLLIDTKEINK